MHLDPERTIRFLIVVLLVIFGIAFLLKNTISSPKLLKKTILVILVFIVVSLILLPLLDGLNIGLYPIKQLLFEDTPTMWTAVGAVSAFIGVTLIGAYPILESKIREEDQAKNLAVFIQAELIHNYEQIIHANIDNEASFAVYTNLPNIFTGSLNFPILQKINFIVSTIRTYIQLHDRFRINNQVLVTEKHALACRDLLLQFGDLLISKEVIERLATRESSYIKQGFDQSNTGESTAQATIKLLAEGLSSIKSNLLLKDLLDRIKCIIDLALETTVNFKQKVHEQHRAILVDVKDEIKTQLNEEIKTLADDLFIN